MSKDELNSKIDFLLTSSECKIIIPAEYYPEVAFALNAAKYTSHETETGVFTFTNDAAIIYVDVKPNLRLSFAKLKLI